ncbi:MAG: entericidin A/B family lipoprotein [Pseudomonadota bacterium]
MILRTLLVMSVLALAACETAEGFGEDVQAGGQAISNAANDVQNDL